MASQDSGQFAYSVARLSRSKRTVFDLVLGQKTLLGLADSLGLNSLSRLKFKGAIRSSGTNDWLLEAKLSARVEQPCVASLEPVTTNVAVGVRRLWLENYHYPIDGSAENWDDDSVEPLPETIDLFDILAHELGLAIPAYPRRNDVELIEMTFSDLGSDSGAVSKIDTTRRPFAELASLRDALQQSRE
ncbi:MAG: DUF177 domain-containing protein [Aestuariivita sp.]|nr:DUF177 domain-containing protein [Aestuariivita sp.]MCY4203285.1 DUF177 domain-containing protein [Aestuariivita sp.]MCY4287188.1 DUF177 domain-containing protein [Aestuariivita sp.]MCY4347504.1 DUF177 domain-containing protein [Aestuariivita sp.]